MKFSAAAILFTVLLLFNSVVEATNLVKSTSADFLFIIGRAGSAGSFRDATLAATTRYIKQLSRTGNDYRFAIVSYGGYQTGPSVVQGFTSNFATANSSLWTINFDMNKNRDALEAIQRALNNDCVTSDTCNKTTCNLTFRDNVDRFVVVEAVGETSQPSYGYTNKYFNSTSDWKYCDHYSMNSNSGWDCTSYSDTVSFTNGIVYSTDNSTGHYYRNESAPAKLYPAYIQEIEDTVKLIQKKNVSLTLIYRPESWSYTSSSFYGAFDETSQYFKSLKNATSDELRGDSTTSVFGTSLLNVVNNDMLSSKCTLDNLVSRGYSDSLYAQVLSKGLPMFVVNLWDFIYKKTFPMFMDTYVNSTNSCPSVLNITIFPYAAGVSSRTTQVTVPTHDVVVTGSSGSTTSICGSPQASTTVYLAPITYSSTTTIRYRTKTTTVTQRRTTTIIEQASTSSTKITTAASTSSKASKASTSSKASTTSMASSSKSTMATKSSTIKHSTVVVSSKPSSTETTSQESGISGSYSIRHSQGIMATVITSSIIVMLTAVLV